MLRPSDMLSVQYRHALQLTHLPQCPTVPHLFTHLRAQSLTYMYMYIVLCLITYDHIIDCMVFLYTHHCPWMLWRTMYVPTHVHVKLLFVSRIWQHLTELVSSTQTTIILTTHYIEEARQANVVQFATYMYITTAAHLQKYTAFMYIHVYTHLCSVFMSM